MKEIKLVLNGRANSYQFYPLLSSLSKKELAADEASDVVEYEGKKFVKNSPYYVQVLLIYDIYSIEVDGVDYTDEINSYDGINAKEVTKEYLQKGTWAMAFDCEETIDTEFLIELEDDEEFNPEKVDLVSVYYWPSGSSRQDDDDDWVSADYIKYDGKMINADSCQEVDCYFNDPERIIRVR